MTYNSREIRGLKAGRYFGSDGSSVVIVSRSDESVTIEVADIEADSVYKFDIPFDAELNDEVPFQFQTLNEQRQSEQEL